jgi:hypothetical protein
MASAILNIARWLAWQVTGHGQPTSPPPARITLISRERAPRE